jgi:hypothetical protein
LNRRVHLFIHTLAELDAVIVHDLRFGQFCHFGIDIDVVHTTRQGRINGFVRFAIDIGKIEPAELEVVRSSASLSSFSNDTSVLRYPGVFTLAILFEIARVRSIAASSAFLTIGRFVLLKSISRIMDALLQKKCAGAMTHL